MLRKQSVLAPDWWDFTTLDTELIQDAASLSVDDLAQLSRPGFEVVFYDTLEEFYLAEAMEYLEAWRQSTADNPVDRCQDPRVSKTRMSDAKAACPWAL